jgi:rubrerythrin
LDVRAFQKSYLVLSIIEYEENFEMNKSQDNLGIAFAGESQANRRYIAFARKAAQEGFPQIAKLFMAAAEAETIHALNHLRIRNEIKSTLNNLETAISGETFEYTEMYPEYIKEAKAEKNKPASWSFEVANKVERIHAGLFSKAVSALQSGKDLDKRDFFVCGICGNTVENFVPEKCPICNAPKNRFSQVV